MFNQKRRAHIKGFGDTIKDSINLDSRAAFANPNIAYLDERYVQITDIDDTDYVPLTGEVTVTGEVEFSDGIILPNPVTSPVGRDDGYLAFTGDTLYFFSGGHRYKLVATLDDVAAGVPGSSIGLLLTLTYP